MFMIFTMPIAYSAILLVWFFSLLPVIFVAWLLKLNENSNLNNHRRMLIFSILLPFCIIGTDVIFRYTMPISGFVVKHTLNGKDLLKSSNGASTYFFHYVVKPTSGYYYSTSIDKDINELNLPEIEKSNIKLRNHLAAFYLSDEDKAEYYNYLTKKYPALNIPLISQ